MPCNSLNSRFRFPTILFDVDSKGFVFFRVFVSHDVSFVRPHRQQHNRSVVVGNHEMYVRYVGLNVVILPLRFDQCIMARKFGGRQRIAKVIAQFLDVSVEVAPAPCIRNMSFIFECLLVRFIFFP